MNNPHEIYAQNSNNVRSSSSVKKISRNNPIIHLNVGTQKFKNNEKKNVERKVKTKNFNLKSEQKNKILIEYQNNKRVNTRIKPEIFIKLK